GIEVLEFGNDIFLSQRKYCIELLHEFGMLGCKLTSVPMEPNTVLNFKVSDDDPALNNITGYYKLVRKLIYLTHTRPDIAYSVHCLSQHMHAPLKSHLQAALNVLRYLKGSPGKGLRFGVRSHGGSKKVGFKELGHDVKTRIHGVHFQKRVWFEVELHGALENHEAEVIQDSNDDVAVAQKSWRLYNLTERQYRLLGN
ncbi:ribonuclease H-like domain-containing protein, partial [Tanacetum coccineum]